MEKATLLLAEVHRKAGNMSAEVQRKADNNFQGLAERRVERDGVCSH